MIKACHTPHSLPSFDVRFSAAKCPMIYEKKPQKKKEKNIIRKLQLLLAVIFCFCMSVHMNRLIHVILSSFLSNKCNSKSVLPSF